MVGRGTNFIFVVELKCPPTAPGDSLGGDSAERGTWKNAQNRRQELFQIRPIIFITCHLSVADVWGIICQIFGSYQLLFQESMTMHPLSLHACGRYFIEYCCWRGPADLGFGVCQNSWWIGPTSPPLNHIGG